MTDHQALDLLIKKLRTRQQTVGFAESCTGGLLSATLASHAGVSDVFKGAVVSYANQAKEDLLQVSPITLKLMGAVSDLTVRQMAQGVRKQLKCEWSVAISGVAGPTGGTEEKPVGTVWFAICGPDLESTERKFFSGSRNEIQKQAVDYAIEFLLTEMN